MTTIAIDVHDRICQDLHQQIRSLIVENERLKAAAQQALDALKSVPNAVVEVAEGRWELKSLLAITALESALVEDALQKFTEVSQEIEAALAEPDWQDLYLKEKKRADMWRDKYESVAGAEQRIYPLAEPVQERNQP